MNTKTKNKLRKLVANQQPPSEDEFTAYDYLAEYNATNETKLTLSGAMGKLRPMVVSGEATVRKGRVNNRQQNIYKLV
jgi:hypothetical protein